MNYYKYSHLSLIPDSYPFIHYHTKYKIHYNSIKCINCSNYGHTIKTCQYPISSYGLICYHYNKDTQIIKYLMIQRKDSLCYVEFIRGRYYLEKTNYISKLFQYITPKEIELIKTKDFDSLWASLWKDYHIEKFQREYQQSKKKFNYLKKGYYNNQGNLINLTKIIKKSKSHMTKELNNEINEINPYLETEWEFPKGRRNINEEQLDCAVREFEEESGLSRKYIQLLNNNTHEEIYKSVNGIRYRNIYYLARCTEMSDSTINLFDENNLVQIKEVNDVKWFDNSIVIQQIRNIYKERRNLFKNVHKEILEYEQQIQLQNVNTNQVPNL
jgi:8-oxo-dGTP pyrophosphatase MutT (NUDIX family)